MLKDTGRHSRRYPRMSHWISYPLPGTDDVQRLIELIRIGDFGQRLGPQEERIH